MSLTRLEHDLLRVAAAYDGTATTTLMATRCGVTRQLVAPVAAGLEDAGLLTRKRLSGMVFYGITEAGKDAIGPPGARSAFLLVEVDADRAREIEQTITAIQGVHSSCEHGGGCCCKNCPWGGDHG